MAGNIENLKGKGFDANPQNRNTNGRPKNKLPDLDEAIANLLGDRANHSKTCTRTKLDVLVDNLYKMAKKNPRAAEILLDRGFGKPKQDVEQKTVIYSVEVTEEEARTLAAQILKDIR